MGGVCEEKSLFATIGCSLFAVRFSLFAIRFLHGTAYFHIIYFPTFVALYSEQRITKLVIARDVTAKNEVTKQDEVTKQSEP
jgi:hypothetical protein